MRDKIYTISISEAFEKGGVCPFCTIESEMESDFARLALGGAMMEPDVREMTNKKGFCAHHYHMLEDEQKVLPLSLIVQSHLNENIINLYKADSISKKSLFGKEKTDCKAVLSALSEKLLNQEKSCYLCERIASDMEKCLDTAIYMWKTEPDFRKVMKESDGFCIKHSASLLKYAAEGLSEGDRKQFLEDFSELQNSRLNEVCSDLTKFVNSFDYRNDEPLTEKVKNSLFSAIKMV